MEPSVATNPLFGRTIRGYEIQEQVGISRWGKVYRALQKSTNRTVAVRILSPELATMPGKTEQFLEESRAAAALVHPHLVTVYEAGQAEGIYFCAMEYMNGPPLAQFLSKENGVDEQRLLLAIAGMAQALDFLWQRKVSHQPVVVKNVLTNLDGAVKLVNVEPIEMPASQSPGEDVVHLAVMIATLANDIAPVSKPVSEFVESLLGTEGHQQFSSPTEVAAAAGALDRKLFPPVKIVRSPGGLAQPKPIEPAILVAVGLLLVVLVGFAVWFWWRSRYSH